MSFCHCKYLCVNVGRCESRGHTRLEIQCKYYRSHSSDDSSDDSMPHSGSTGSPNIEQDPRPALIEPRRLREREHLRVIPEEVSTDTSQGIVRQSNKREFTKVLNHFQTVIEDMERLKLELEDLSRSFAEADEFAGSIEHLKQKYRQLGELYKSLNVGGLMKWPVMLHQNIGRMSGAPLARHNTPKPSSHTLDGTQQPESSRAAALRPTLGTAADQGRRVPVGKVQQSSASEPGKMATHGRPRYGNTGTTVSREAEDEPVHSLRSTAAPRGQQAALDGEQIQNENGEDEGTAYRVTVQEENLNASMVNGLGE